MVSVGEFVRDARAITASLPAPNANWREARTILRARSQVVKAYVLQRAEGICELTGEPAPFLTKDGQPYLEVHHIRRLSDGGLDHPVNCAAISPTARTRATPPKDEQSN